MKLLLFLILVTVGEVAYFNYTVQQQTSGGFQHRLGDWQDELSALQGKNKQLTDTHDYLRKTISATEIRIEMLTDQLKGVPGSNPSAVRIGRSDEAWTPAAPAAPIPAVGENIGTVTTLSGQTFENCQLLKVEPDGITFNHTEGITKVLYRNLSLDLQKRFGVDPQSTATAEAAKVRYQEQLQQAGTGTGGNAGAGAAAGNSPATP
ncbi:MAG: hypothetical protein ACRD5L_06495 [Bryobacteraceae bacterium]